MKKFLSFDEKFISNIFKKYSKAKAILQRNNFDLHEKIIFYGENIINSDQLNDYQYHLRIVETVLALMPKAEYICLVQNFLNKDINDEKSNWWKKHYSQDVYEKLKYKAINRFLYLFLI